MGDRLRTPHPGKTPAQRRILDHIGCGNNSPIMAKATRDALLKNGLIELCGFRLIGGPPLQVRVDLYQMPTPVHMKWCAWCAGEDEPEAVNG